MAPLTEAPTVCATVWNGHDRRDRQVDLRLELAQDARRAASSERLDLRVRQAEDHRLGDGAHERNDQRPENDERKA